MHHEEQLNKMIDETLGSMDDAKRAAPKPYLLTRINARLRNTKEPVWERAGRFITRPVVVISGLCLIIGINVLVIAFNNNNNTTSGNAVAEQQATQDEFSTNIASLYDIENTEP